MSNEVRFLSYRSQAVMTLKTALAQIQTQEGIATTGKAPGSLQRELKRLRVWLADTERRMRAVPLTRGEKAQAIADKNARKRRDD